MDLELSGKLALVTGASAGIGLATALTLAAEGCDVVLVARSERKLEEARRRVIDETARQAFIFPADLSRSSDVDAVAREWAGIDILVNNAGSIPTGHIWEVDEVAWQTAWDLKVFGYINMMRQFYPAMCERGHGVIINIIGIAGEVRLPGYICGVTGNAGLTAMTLSLGSDGPKHGVRVVGVSPGPVDTQRLSAQAPPGGNDVRWPFGRPATTREVADSVAFLASRRAGYISGAVLAVDGGISASSGM